VRHPVRVGRTESHPSEGEEKDRLVICQLRVTLPRGLWSAELSRRHPGAIIDVTDRMEWSPGKNLAIFRIYDSETWSCIEELKGMKDVLHVEESSKGGTFREFHIIHDAPPFLSIFARLGVMQRTPIRINNGISTWEIVGTSSKIKLLVDALHKLPMTVEIDPMYRSAERLVSARRLDLETGGPPFTPVGRDSIHFVVCKVRIALPPPFWHRELAEKHPGTSLEVLGYSLAGDWMFVDLRVHTRDLTAWIDDLRASDGVCDVRPLGRIGKATTIRITYKRHPLFTLINDLHLILRMPATIREGFTNVIVAGPDDSIKRLMKAFPPPQIKVEAVYDSERGDADLLTPRQSDIFHRALAAGYFDVPRHVSLTELATRVGVAVSSLSEMLAIVEKKLLQESQTTRDSQVDSQTE